MARRRRQPRQRGPVTGAVITTVSPFVVDDIEALESVDEARIYLARLGWPEYAQFLPDDEEEEPPA